MTGGSGGRALAGCGTGQAEGQGVCRGRRKGWQVKSTALAGVQMVEGVKEFVSSDGRVAGMPACSCPVINALRASLP